MGRDAGIGDVDVHRAERPACGVEQGPDAVRARGVCGRRDATDHRSSLGGRTCVDVAGHHRGAGRCQRRRNGPADARARSGDHRHRAVDLHGHMSTAPVAPAMCRAVLLRLRCQQMLNTSTTTDTATQRWATAHRPSTLRRAGTPTPRWPARSTESGTKQPDSESGWT